MFSTMDVATSDEVGQYYTQFDWRTKDEVVITAEGFTVDGVTNGEGATHYFLAAIQ